MVDRIHPQSLMCPPPPQTYLGTSLMSALENKVQFLIFGKFTEK